MSLDYSKGIYLLTGILFITLYCDRQRGSGRELQDFSHLQTDPAPEWARKGVLYEIFPRVFSEEGTFTGIEEKLDHIQELGATIIWLMPIFPVGEKDRKGSLGSPYAATDLRSVNPDYGTEEELHRLISAIHHRGMKIILDIIPNHAANDAVSNEKYTGWFVEEGDELLLRKEADWTDVKDFDYQNPAVRTYMKETFLYWLREFNVDGFRCDVAGLVPYDFWQETLAALKEVKPDVYLLAEWEDPEILLAGFHSDYGWTEYHDMINIRIKEQRSSTVLQTVQLKSDLYPQNHLTMRFLENHDEIRSLDAFGIQAIEAYAALLFTLPGIPLIYAGQEMGALQQPSLFEKSVIPWEDVDTQLYHMYQRLIQFRKNTDCLTDGAFLQAGVASLRGSVGAFVRWNENSAALVVTNLHEKTAEQIVITMPEELLDRLKQYQWHSSDDQANLPDWDNLYFNEIFPYQTLIFFGK